MSIEGRWAKPVLTGERVVLRPMAASDADAMWESVNDPEGRDLTMTTATFDRATIDAWCSSRADQDDRLDLTIVELATGEVAGEVVLNDFDAETETANFRIGLRGPDWYGRRLGGEATRLVVAHALTSVASGGIGLSAVTLTVLARNERARRAYERAGFAVSGEYDEDGERWVEMVVRQGPDSVEGGHPGSG